jgi:MFS family permease
MDRRYVLAGLAAIASASGLAIVIVRPEDIGILFGLIALYGAMSYTLYSIIVAHANDYAANDQFVTVSSGLLLLYGIGTIIGPLISGVTMAYSPYLLFAVTAAAHFAVAAYAIFRSFVRACGSGRGKRNLCLDPSARAATPNRSISIRVQPHRRNETWQS